MISASDRRSRFALLAALGLFVGIRLVPAGGVYRSGAVVLSGNDPWYYRHWIEHGAAFGSLPDAVAVGEPLFVATLAAAVDLVGTGALVWYPVVAATVVAGLTYTLAVSVTGDRWVGVVAVVLLAVIPGHAARTGVGYADHHAFDYIWLLLASVSLVRLLSVGNGGRRWLYAVGLGVAVAAQTLAWEAGPLLLVPIAVVVCWVAVASVSTGRPSRPQLAAIVAGLGLGAVVVLAAHVVLGWHSTTVALVPVMLVLGAVGSGLTAHAVARVGGGWRGVVSIWSACVLVLIVALVGVGRLGDVRAGVTRLLETTSAAETAGLFDPASLGVVMSLGFVVVVAIGPMVAALRAGWVDWQWIVPAAYAWWLLALASGQMRFVGELAPFLALFGAIGVVALLDWLDAGSLPDRQTVATAAVVLLLVGGFGAVQAMKLGDDLVADDDDVEVAVWLEDHADGGKVIGAWDRVRLYNYFANGDSQSYKHAQSNYDELVGGDPAAWHRDHAGHVEYVVASGDVSNLRRSPWFDVAYRSSSGSRTVFAVRGL